MNEITMKDQHTGCHGGLLADKPSRVEMDCPLQLTTTQWHPPPSCRQDNPLLYNMRISTV